MVSPFYFYLVGHRVDVLYFDDLEYFFGPIWCVSISKEVLFLGIRTRSPILNCELFSNTSFSYR